MRGFLRRLIGAMRLDPSTYEEVEADRGATVQALAVVLLASLANEIGLMGTGSFGARAVGASALAALIGWAAWAALIYLVGARMLPEPRTRADVGELLRTTGFAAAPGLLWALGVVPVVGVPIFLIVSVWMVAAMVVAVRQALDYSSLARAVGVCTLAWLFSLGLAIAIGTWLGPTVS